MAVLVPIVVSITVVIIHITMAGLELDQIFIYVVLESLIYMIGALWYLTCEVLCESAAILAEDFQRVI